MLTNSPKPGVDNSSRYKTNFDDPAAKRDEDFFSLEEIANYLHVSISHLKHLIRERELPSYSPSRKLTYLKLAEVKAWLENNRTSSEFELGVIADKYSCTKSLGNG